MNGKRHRLGGPAIEYTWGEKNWYVNGYPIIESNYLFAVENFLASRVKV